MIIKLKELEYKNWQSKNKQFFELEHSQSCPFKITLRVWLNNISIHYYKVFVWIFLKGFTALYQLFKVFIMNRTHKSD